MKKISSDKTIFSVILAAGEGRRMKAKKRNKVTFRVAGIPIIKRTIGNLKEAGIENIIVVVGHAKESVISILDTNVQMAEQPERLGTANALKHALPKIPKLCRNIIVAYGDDSFSITPQIFLDLYKFHIHTNSIVTLLTAKVKNPFGLGRILRNKTGKIIKIVEEKDATEEEKKISEINAACYVFDAVFLRECIDEVPKNPKTGEYYLTSLIDIAIKHKKKVSTLALENFKWQGVNSRSELQKAQRLFQL
ncbi:MAG: hypothetical protein A3C27_03885 [Candidatus Levybacteria bacterium RIFCSPHIGHO2_02_FULL_39_36]|nr:MAG: Bifunctional protein GlmU [Candidatus Levybacteria bacterium GW2011_GWA1_39_11]KKR24845.1 MAG: Bifunctional protein GlmU [Candidatus Levybacteria bacterium GW2011_GWB1_39_7]KKR50086.1 MAG: Bifunctional protein GlmU [Candidatus Levybacteria bacterium GW2011_GWA2_40_16]OGH15465.1 MAG: hypothetical protein A2689_02030 [Candidatus Levybacteria bacterium RIFCSPHIGHO2_01_FULL_38_96]OGH26017.1 MAG: hypothetical protein A3E68_03200 [Candidatus Levybacteria bacterium RIFCSPHIGHO2_12_FULL_39_39]